MSSQMPTPEPPAAPVEDLRPVGRLEVAVFVEDVVGGQQRLAKHLPHLAVGQQRRGVVERPSRGARVGLGQPEQQRRTRRPAAEPAPRRPPGRVPRTSAARAGRGADSPAARAPRRPPDRLRRAARRRPPRPAGRRCRRGRPRSDRSVAARSSCRARYHDRGPAARRTGGAGSYPASRRSLRPSEDIERRATREPGGRGMTDDGRATEPATGVPAPPERRPSWARRAGPWRPPSLPSSS